MVLLGFLECFKTLMDLTMNWISSLLDSPPATPWRSPWQLETRSRPFLQTYDEWFPLKITRIIKMFWCKLSQGELLKLSVSLPNSELLESFLHGSWLTFWCSAWRSLLICELPESHFYMVLVLCLQVKKEPVSPGGVRESSASVKCESLRGCGKGPCLNV